MDRYCVFELIGNKYSVVDVFSSYDMADDFASSMNNFLTDSDRKKRIVYVVRKLDKSDDITSYNPISYKINI